MSYNYTTYLADVANLMPTQVTDPGFQAMQNNMIDYSELRCYRALNLLDETVRDSSGVLTVGTRNFTLPTTNGTFINVEGFNVITPAGTSNADSGTRNQMTAASKEMIDALWPSSSYTAVPIHFAPITQDTFIVGPFPNGAYNIEVIGVQRPTPLYVSQTTSPLTQYFPDIFLAASMVFASGYMKNYGATADDPQQPGSWETQFKNLLEDAKTEESRKRFLAERYQGPPMPTQKVM